jgi:hypothetical protein
MADLYPQRPGGSTNPYDQSQRGRSPTAPQIPSPPGFGDYNQTSGIYGTPSVGPPGTQNVGGGYQQGNQYGQYAAQGPSSSPPPWMKNPTYNQVYGVWEDFAQPTQWDPAAEQAYNDQRNASMNQGASWGFGPQVDQNAPAAPYSQGGPGTTSTTGQGGAPPPQVVNEPPAPGVTPPQQVNPIQQSLGMSNEQWAALMNMIYGYGRGVGPDNPYIPTGGGGA